MVHERSSDPSDEPSTAPRPDFRKSTQQSPLGATTRHAPFADPISPEAVLIREVQASFRTELELLQKNINGDRDRSARELDRVGRMTELLWTRIVKKDPPTNADAVDQTELLVGSPERRRISRLVAGAFALGVIMVLLEIGILYATIGGR